VLQGAGYQEGKPHGPRKDVEEDNGKGKGILSIGWGGGGEDSGNLPGPISNGKTPRESREIFCLSWWGRREKATSSTQRAKNRLVGPERKKLTCSGWREEHCPACRKRKKKKGARPH